MSSIINHFIIVRRNLILYRFIFFFFLSLIYLNIVSILISENTDYLNLELKINMETKNQHFQHSLNSQTKKIEESLFARRPKTCV